MVSVTYPFQFAYPLMEGGHFPALQLRMQALQEPPQPVDVYAYLDSGAEQSLFDGGIARAIGLDLLTGRPKRYRSTVGEGIDARLHRVHLVHDDLGAFELEVGFSSGEISRNLLGRDFFNLVQIGFREHHLTFHVNPVP